MQKNLQLLSIEGNEHIVQCVEIVEPRYYNASNGQVTQEKPSVWSKGYTWNYDGLREARRRKSDTTVLCRVPLVVNSGRKPREIVCTSMNEHGNAVTFTSVGPYLCP